jgi:hypothetical protein
MSCSGFAHPNCLDTPLVPHVRIVIAASGRRRGILEWSEDAVEPSRLPPWRYCWHAFNGRGWPLTAAEETVFAAELVQLADAAGGGGARDVPSRDDFTVTLAALRCGITVSELFDTLPGANPAVLADAYRTLDERRAASAAAWETILADPDPDVVTAHRRAASLLAPVPVQLLYGSASIRSDDLVDRSDAEIAEWAESTLTEMARVHTLADEVEAALGWFTPPSAEGVELGRLLYDPQSPALWSEPYFVAPRVGALVPLRVAELLDENRRRRR